MDFGGDDSNELRRVRLSENLRGCAVFCGIFLSFFIAVGHYAFEESNRLIISGTLIVSVTLAGIIIGGVAAWILGKVSPSWGSTEIQEASGWSIGAAFAWGLCVSGTCILPAALSGLGALLLMLPFRIGAHVVSVIKGEQH